MTVFSWLGGFRRLHLQHFDGPLRKGSEIDSTESRSGVPSTLYIMPTALTAGTAITFAIGEHAINTNHDIDWANASVVDSQSCLY